MEKDFLKLTNIVYKLLEFFPESDPLKHRAKDKALTILEHLELADETQRLPAGRQGWTQAVEGLQTEKIKTQVREDIDVLLGYLWIGKAQGWINSANCLIVTAEYEKIKHRLQPIVSELAQELSEIKEPIKEPVTDKELADIEFTDRQGKILDFISKNPKTQVKDLQKFFPDVTKRTIRRDLEELLMANKIRRIGEHNEIVYSVVG